MAGDALYACVIVDVPIAGVDHPFDYAIGPELRGRLQLGHRVVVPFGRRRVEGYVVGFAASPEVAEVKQIVGLIDEQPVLTPADVELARWMARRYLCLQVEALRCFLPPGARLAARTGARPKRVRGYRLQQPAVAATAAVRDLEVRAPRQAAALAVLAEQPQATIPAATLVRRGITTMAALKSLEGKGWITAADVSITRDPFGGVLPQPSAPLELTGDQMVGLQAIARAAGERTPGVSQTFLLRGVTGSGKTEVYLRAIAATIARGRSAIVLVPEIALTPQTVDRFRARFGSRVAVLHSALGLGERFDQWHSIHRGETDIVVGARSAVFAPVRDLGLIVVDEEHEPTYKQEESPRYHAREVALERARLAGAPVVLGSATPALESSARAATGEFQLLEIPHRVSQRPLPPVEIVDLREELRAGNRSLFSRRLQTALRTCIQRGEQALLFLNRRGFSTFVLCRECGHVLQCGDCAVSLTVHTGARQLRCHYCDTARDLPARCPQCGGKYLREFGAGTQRVEAQVRETVPDVRVLRMDMDTTGRKGSHQQILDAFRRGEAQVLVGTQMIAKGLDFPAVTLVGVVAADTALHLPDFRSAERTFQLLTQVAGRAGRGEVPGQVVVQTYAPDHYSILAAAAYDYPGFYQREMQFRARAGYPPVTGLVRVVVSAEDESAARTGAQTVARALVQAAEQFDDGTTVFGPAPAPLSRVKNRYRWHVLVKGAGDGPREVAREARAQWQADLLYQGVTVTIDPDPLSLL